MSTHSVRASAIPPAAVLSSVSKSRSLLGSLCDRGVPSGPRALQARPERRLHAQPKRADLPVQRLPREFRVTVVKGKDLGRRAIFRGGRCTRP